MSGRAGGSARLPDSAVAQPVARAGAEMQRIGGTGGAGINSGLAGALALSGGLAWLLVAPAVLCPVARSARRSPHVLGGPATMPNCSATARTKTKIVS